jgi:hypothetical protein
MAKATEPVTTIPSRRAFLTGAAPAAAAFALVGGAAANAVATGLAVATPQAAVAPASDPIFALIDLHRTALRRERRKYKLLEKQGDAEDDAHRGVVVGEKPVRKRESIQDDDDAHHIRYVPTGEMKPIVVWSEDVLANHAPTDLSETERAAWIKEKTKELQRNQRAYFQREDDSPRGRAYDAWNAANEITLRLSKQMIETRPTTMAGVAAVLAHWSRVMDEDEHDRDFFSTREFLKKIAEAVQAIAGQS